MKTKNLLRKIVSAAMLLALMIIVVMSCKKKDDTPDPTPPGPMPTPLATPDVFSYRPLHMMSDYELGKNLSFPGHLLYQLGNGLAGEDDPSVLNPFKKIGKTAWEVYDYSHTEMRFDQIDQGITQIQDQLADLQTSVNDLIGDLGILTSDINSLQIQIAITPIKSQIQTAMLQTTNLGFQWYPHRMSLYKAGQLSEQDIKSDTSALRTFCENIYTGQTAVVDWEMNLYNLVDLSGANGFAPLTNLLISATKSTNKFDSATVMQAYKILESYFISIVNLQYQCNVLYTNADCYKNPQDTAIVLPWTSGTFMPHIQKEMQLFQSAVNFMVVNLNEYRYNSRFQSDMAYANSGLAPDAVFIHVLARCQFLMNLLTQAMQLPSPVISGAILTPHNYTNGASNVVNNLTVNLSDIMSYSENVDSTALNIQSQIPYTYWTAGNTASCAPDNTWNLYRFNFQYNPNGNQVPLNITVVDNGSNTSPWQHYSPMTGSFQFAYYNPQNPSQTSWIPNQTCTLPFGYFSACWPWGFLWMTNSQGSQWQHPIFYIPQFNKNVEMSQFQQTPFAGTTGSGSQAVFSKQNSAQFSYPNASLGTMLMGGSTSYTSNYYIAADLVFCNVKPAANLPPNGGQIQAWTYYKAKYGMAGSGGSDLTISFGKGLNEVKGYDPTSYYSAADILNNHYHDQTNTWFTGFGNSGNLNTGTTYQPNIQYYYQTYNLSNVVNADIELYTGFQFLYGGYYNLPPFAK